MVFLALLWLLGVRGQVQTQNKEMVPKLVSTTEVKDERKQRKAFIQREYQGNTENIAQRDGP